jgi:hypothetical protein
MLAPLTSLVGKTDGHLIGVSCRSVVKISQGCGTPCRSIGVGHFDVSCCRTFGKPLRRTCLAQRRRKSRLFGVSCRSVVIVSWCSRPYSSVRAGHFDVPCCRTFRNLLRQTCLAQRRYAGHLLRVSCRPVVKVPQSCGPASARALLTRTKAFKWLSSREFGGLLIGVLVRVPSIGCALRLSYAWPHVLLVLISRAGFRLW